MDPISRLTEIFRHFPGIGPRQAKRFVYYLLTRDKSTLNFLSQTVSDLKDSISLCDMCFRYFEDKNATLTSRAEKLKQGPLICNICSNAARDQKLLLVVPHDQDLEVIEKSHSYNGLYFVLGGTIPILEKAPEDKVRIKELLMRVKNGLDGKMPAEIIVGTSVNPEGENTASHIYDVLKPITTEKSIALSFLGRGLSTGTELEYSDSDTLKFAFQSRIKK